jgi:hypothetical protein
LRRNFVLDVRFLPPKGQDKVPSFKKVHVLRFFTVMWPPAHCRL